MEIDEIALSEQNPGKSILTPLAPSNRTCMDMNSVKDTAAEINSSCQMTLIQSPKQRHYHEGFALALDVRKHRESLSPHRKTATEEYSFPI